MNAISTNPVGRATRLRQDGDAGRAGILDFRAFGAFLRRRIRLIATVAALVIAAAVAFVAVATPRYTATAVLLVDPRQQRVVQSEAVLPGIGADAAAIESQVEVIGSTAIAERVVGELGLAADEEFTRPGLVERLKSLVGAGRELTPDERSERVLARFGDALKVARRGLTYVLEIRFTSTGRDKAARIANAVASAYLAEQAAAKTSATTQAAEFLNGRLGELRSRVADAERAVATFKAQNAIVATGEGRTLSERQLSELNQQLVLARARTAEAKARLDQVSRVTAASLGAGAIPEALMSPVVINLRSQYAEAARRETEAESQLGPRHPAVTTAKAQLTDARVQIEREIARVTAGIRNEAEVAERRERSLDASLAELTRRSGATDQASVKLRELEREAQASRTLLEQSLLRYRETSEQEGLARPDARVLSPAVPPARASEPKTTVLLLAGFVGALLAGVGAAGVAENLSRGFRTPREVEASLAMPVLGHLPLVDAKSVARRAAVANRRRPGAGANAGSRAAAQLASNRPLARLAVEQPLTAFGEGLRTVRSRLAAEAEGRPQVLAVVSAVPNEGKSTVAANLAHSFAKSGLKTLLVDVDVRKPRPASARSGFGLLQMVAGGVGVLDEHLHIDPVSGLKVLPIGEIEDVAAASELVTGPAMRDFLERARTRYAVTVLDAPPLLPFVDGRELLDFADCGLFVVEWNRTDPDSAGAALDTVGPGVRKIAGALLNKVDPRAGTLYDYGYAYEGRKAG